MYSVNSLSKSNSIIYKTREKSLKIYIEAQKIMNSKRSTKQKESCQVYHSTCLQAVLQSRSDDDSLTHRVGDTGSANKALSCAYLQTSEHVGLGGVAYLTSGVDKNGHPVVDEDGYISLIAHKNHFKLDQRH